MEYEKLKIKVDGNTNTLKAYTESGKMLSFVESIKIDSNCDSPAFVTIVFVIDKELNPMIE